MCAIDLNYGCHDTEHLRVGVYSPSGCGSLGSIRRPDVVPLRPGRAQPLPSAVQQRPTHAPRPSETSLQRFFRLYDQTTVRR